MKIHCQSVFDKWDIEDKSVQSLITSPPYYSLRKYSIPDVIIGDIEGCQHEFSSTIPPRGKSNWDSLDKYWKTGGLRQGNKESYNINHGNFCIHCHAWQGQHGLEPTFKLYLEHCKLWMQEAIRVLRDDGVIFVNLGDSYNNSSAQIGREDKSKYGGKSGLHCLRGGNADYPNKSKLLIPERFAIMCVDELGLILRNHIVWYKPNGMPESCQDRFSKKWESILMFVKSGNTLCWKHDKTKQWVWEKPEPDYYFVDDKRRNHWGGFDYYFDLDAIREPHAQVSIERLNRAVSNNNKWVNGADGQTKHNLSQPRPNRNTKISKEESEMFGSPRARYHRKGANTGENNKEPYKQNNPHLLRITKALDREYTGRWGNDGNGMAMPEKWNNPKGKNPGDCWSIPTMPSPERHFAMWPEKLVERMILCSTKAGDTVLDPFCGSGTTLRVADGLNRIGLGLELGYREIQEKRLSEIQKELILA